MEYVYDIVGLVLSLLGFGWALVKVLDAKAEKRQDRMEQRHRECMRGINEDLRGLHSRVNEIQDRYVKQEVHDRDINTIRASITEFRTEMKQDITNGLHAFNEGVAAMRKDFTDYLIKLAERTKN